MRKVLFTIIILSIPFLNNCYCQELTKATAYVSLSFNIGKQNIGKKSKAQSPTESFGLNLNAGIFMIQNDNYKGGIQISLIQGFYYSQSNFDNKLGKKSSYHLAQQKGVNIGWFSELKSGDDSKIFHNLGIGLWGVKNKNKKLNLGFHCATGIIVNSSEPTNFKLGLSINTTLKNISNAKEGLNNIAFMVGGYKNINPENSNE